MNDLLRQLNNNEYATDDNAGSSPITLSQTQLSALLGTFQQQQAAIAAMTNQTSPRCFCSSATDTTFPSSQQPNTLAGSTKRPEYCNTAKYEDLISIPIRPLYDGSSKQSVPFLNRLDICRQDEGWYPITFLVIHNNKYDLIRDFT